MKALVVGGGGREHAIAWKLAQSPNVQQVYVAPGNAGTAHEDQISNLDISATDINALLNFAKHNDITLTIVGPEAPLALGIVDQFNAAKLACFGPSQAAAQLESSKAFCKQFMQQQNIPTAAYATFDNETAAVEYLQNQQYPQVIKADGLAAGKGVVIAEDKAQAEAAVHAMLTDKQFGDAGNHIVIEDFLRGEELSYMVMVDGKNILPLASSQDHKRRDDGDQGPNTGGMGAYSPSPLLDDALEAIILKQVIEPTVNAMQANGTPYTGFLYAGLMISPEGKPVVLEFNCRLGDPETQPILMRLQSDLAELCLAATNGSLDTANTQWDPRVALDVVLCAGGYPLNYNKGDTITGLAGINNDQVKVFHAGTAEKDGNVVTSGGRVLAVCALADDISCAQQLAYQAAKKIDWSERFYRHDIGYRALQQKV
ncbi:MAG: phosphoribosylamine--glycine ligase [Coxiellaceae bacterium]|nr:phosphoribosylamine--glycine ligase [Coxiellaceae bacterium]